MDLGLSKNENNVFELTQNTTTQDAYTSIQWAIENKEKLESLGFSLENLKIDGKKIDSNTVTIAFSNTIQNDWFDIKMTVVCDDFEFNFSELIPNIKSLVCLAKRKLLFDSVRMDDALQCDGKIG